VDMSSVQAAETTATINTSVLNVRGGPGLSYNVVKKVKQGEKYSIVERKGDWVKIKLSGSQQGWVASWLIKESSPTAVDSSTLKASVNGLRIRTGPGASFQIIGHLDKGQEANFQSKNENWTKIKYKNTVGWVSSQYLDSSQGSVRNPDPTNTGTSKTGKITATVLNVRSNPTLQGSVVGKLKRGDSIVIVSEREDWVEIRFKQANAWIHSDFVSLSASNTQTSNPSPEPTLSKTGKVTASSLNVRDSGSLNGKVVASIKQGEKVKILSESNQWLEIQMSNGKKGWIAGWFVQVDTAPQPQQQTPSDNHDQDKVTILHNGTNLRSGPSTNSKVVARVNEGNRYQILATKGDWYEIQLSNNKTAYVAGWIVSVSGTTEKIERPGVNQYLKGQTIVLDPGHGGNDSGALGRNGTLEKNLTLRTARLLYDKLSAAGANVILTRNSDSYVSLASRVSISHYRNADVFLSVHYDSSVDSSARGITSYYYESLDRPVAQTLQPEMIKYTGLRDRGSRIGNFQVLRTNRQPSVLLELGYLSNLSEELTVNSSSFQEKVSNGVYYGLAHYFKAN